MPDKVGRQINVAGWAEESNFGVRLYTPSGSDGVNGTTDWQENVNELALQVLFFFSVSFFFYKKKIISQCFFFQKRARWYPTATVMANGSILVMGGEIGSNAAPQPNLEIVPNPPGGTVVNLDFLLRTDPNNLYPFVIVLPSKNLFVGEHFYVLSSGPRRVLSFRPAYYNEARILEPVNFNTIKVLPNIPGNVNNCKPYRSLAFYMVSNILY